MNNYIDIFGNNWSDDIEDLAYLYDSFKIEKSNTEKLKFIKLSKNNGEIMKIEVLKNFEKLKNFNDFIIYKHFSNI